MRSTRAVANNLFDHMLKHRHCSQPSRRRTAPIRHRAGQRASAILSPLLRHDDHACNLMSRICT